MTDVDWPVVKWWTALLPLAVVHGTTADIRYLTCEDARLNIDADKPNGRSSVDYSDGCIWQICISDDGSTCNVASPTNRQNHISIFNICSPPIIVDSARKTKCHLVCAAFIDSTLIFALVKEHRRHDNLLTLICYAMLMHKPDMLAKH